MLVEQLSPGFHFSRFILAVGCKCSDLSIKFLNWTKFDLMCKNKVFYFLTFLSFFSISSYHTHGQAIDELLEHPWVDSVFESMSVTERFNQLLILEINEEDLVGGDLPSTFGGAIVISEEPEAYRQIVSGLRNALSIPPLVVAMLKDQYYGTAIDIMPGFGSPMTLAAITEPYLLYETGRMLAAQSSWLGISCLISSSSDLMHRDVFRNEWRLMEINQGLMDQHILPLNYLQLREFDSITPEELGLKNALISISPDSIENFHEYVRSLIAEGKLDMQAMDRKCKRILTMKLFAGTDDSSMPREASAKENIQRISASFKANIYDQSVTLLKNNSNLVPLIHLEGAKIASLSVGKTDNSLFEHYLDNYARVDHYNVSYDAEDSVFANLWTVLNGYDYIICAMYESESFNSGIGNTAGFSIFENWLNQSGKCVLAYFGNPALLETNRFILDNKTFMLAYEDNDENNALIPQLIFGGVGAYGKLPVNISYRFLKDEGIILDGLGRFRYASPESGGLNSSKLQKIDSIVDAAIQNGAMPGCQVLVAKDNKVIYQKAFGFHSYDSIKTVNDHDLYDLASITKVSGALPALMKLYEEGKFDLEATMGTYLPYFKRGNKKRLTYREILAHQSGLTPYIVYWQTAMKKNGKYRRKTLSNEQSDAFQYEISPGLYLHEDYRDKIYKQIKKSKLGEKKYRYSGLTFLLYPEIIESITGQKYEQYLQENFYKPLGASSLTYNPLEKFSIENIVPTEYDSMFRKRQVHGTVHDEAAAVMRGVSSNAGLFSNANDLAKLFQMYCNYGTFGGREYLSEETLLEFTRCQYPENDNLYPFDW